MTLPFWLIRTPKNNSRPGRQFYVEFAPGIDPEGDAQTVQAWVASNPGFVNAKVYFH